MINISDVVRDIVTNDEIAYPAFQAGLINLSSYARKIKPQVEDLALKPVQSSSIVIALSRLSLKFAKNEIKNSKINIQSISVNANLVDFTYEKTNANLHLIRKLQKEIPETYQGFFTVTQGTTEITIIADAKIWDLVKSNFNGVESLFERENLTGITVKFGVNYLDVPNVMFEITKKLAIKNMNIIEMVSTATELTFIIERKDTEIAVGQLSKLL